MNGRLTFLSERYGDLRRSERKVADAIAQEVVTTGARSRSSITVTPPLAQYCAP